MRRALEQALSDLATLFVSLAEGAIFGVFALLEAIADPIFIEGIFWIGVITCLLLL